MKIKSIKIINKPNETYNLWVKKNNNYIANGIVAHNCHQLKASEVKDVATNIFKDCYFRWGLTGTVNKQKADLMCLQASIGLVADEKITAKELQDKGFLSSCNINCIRLKDDIRFLDYPTEVDYLSTDDSRLEFISNLIANITKTKNNTLVLLNRIVTGEVLEKKLMEKDVDVIFLNGSISSKKRFEEYESIKTNNNKCILATAQIAATGLNIPRLFNLVFLDFGQSFVRTIQGTGRGLRLAKDKNHVDVFDISSTTKFSKRHFNERIKYYQEAQYPFKILEIPNWK